MLYVNRMNGLKIVYLFYIRNWTALNNLIYIQSPTKNTLLYVNRINGLKIVYFFYIIYLTALNNLIYIHVIGL